MEMSITKKKLYANYRSVSAPNNNRQWSWDQGVGVHIIIQQTITINQKCSVFFFYLIYVPCVSFHLLILFQYLQKSMHFI